VSRKPNGERLERVAHLGWVPLGKVKVNPLAQRDMVNARVDKLVAEFDPEQLGNPVVNHRGDAFFVIDGQHRIAALREWLGEDWETQHVQCEVYEGLSEDEEAEVFLKRNDTLAVHAFAKFRVAVQAGRPDEVEIDRVVRQCGLRVSQEKKGGAVSAVGTLVRVFRRSDPQTLGRTLLLIRDAYGDAGLEAIVIDGLGLLCHRYNGDLDDTRLVKRLGDAHAGVNGLLNKAEILRNQTGNPKAHCVAAAAVEIYNGTRGGKKLPSWWRAEQ
jgi:hypothetical protein